MTRFTRFGAGCAVGLAVILGLAACGGGAGGGGGDDDRPTTTAAAAPQTIGTCQIRPGTICPSANLAGANLAGVNLSGANLSQANLTGANLAGANLSDANLASANLTAALLTGATLTNTNMAGANLTQTNFTGATISGINDTGTTQCETIRNDGSVNNAGCPSPSTVTTSRTTSTTAAGTTPVNLPCAGQPGLFLTVYQSQADNFGVAADLVSATTVANSAEPACSSDGWATLNLQNPDGDFLAVYIASSNGWQLVSVAGCRNARVPAQDQAGLC